MPLTIDEASRQVHNRYPDRFTFEEVKNTLTTMGGDRFICTDDMWRYYGFRKVCNTMLRNTDQTSGFCAGLMNTLSVS